MKKIIILLTLFFFIYKANAQENLVHWWKSRNNLFYPTLLFDDTRNYLYAFRTDKRFEVWDYQQGKIVNTIENFPHILSSPDISSDGKYIISPGVYNEFVDIYEIEKNKFISRVLYDTNADAEYVKFLPNDTKFISLLKDGHTIQVLDAADSLFSETFLYNDTSAVPSRITHFSRNGRYLYYYRRDSSWVLFDLVDRDTVYQGKFLFRPDIGGITNDGEFILMRSSYQQYELYSLKNQTTIKETKIGDYNHRAFLCPDEKTLTVETMNPIFFNIDIVSLLNTEEKITTDVILSDVSCYSNKNLFAGTKKDAKICIVDIKTGKLVSEFSTIEVNEHKTNVKTVKFTKDGKYVVSGDAFGIINVWNTETGNLYKTIDKTNGVIENISISNDNSKMFASTTQYELLTFDIQDEFKLIGKIENLQPSIIRDISFPKLYNQQNANDFLAVAYDGKVFKMENDSLQIIDTTGIHYTCLDVTPDGKQIAIGSKDKFVRVYNLSGDSLILFKEWIAEISTNEASPGIRDVFYSPDGKYLVTLSSWDRIVKIWETNEYSLYKEIGIKNEQGSLNCGLFYDGSQRLITTGFDNVLKFWDIDSSFKISMIDTMSKWGNIYSRGMKEMTNSIELHPNGKQLAVGDEYGNVIIFNLPDTLFTDVNSNISPINEIISISPNPFSQSTKFRFYLVQTANVNLTIYNSLGQEIAVLCDEWKTAGEHEINFNGSSLNSGVYYYRFSVGSENHFGKLVLIK